MTWQPHWARRGGRPWELDDLRQEAWLVFSGLIAAWDEKEPFGRYVTAYFPWRLRRILPLASAARIPAACAGLDDAESIELVARLAASLPPRDAELLRMRVTEGASVADAACRLGVSRRTVARRWSRIRRRVRDLLSGEAP